MRQRVSSGGMADEVNHTGTLISVKGTDSADTSAITLQR